MIPESSVTVEKVTRPKLAQGVVDDGESDDDGQDKAESEQSDINDDETEKRVDSRAITPEVDGGKDEPAVVEVERDPEPVARPGSLVCIDSMYYTHSPLFAQDRR